MGWEAEEGEEGFQGEQKEKALGKLVSPYMICLVWDRMSSHAGGLDRPVG